MKLYKGVVGLSVLLSAMGAIGLPAWGAELKAKSVVLVHGAFADGSSWHKVIPYLENVGLKVVAVQNPLDSLENDAAATRRAIRNAEGPVVLVGHSWAGVVITEAGNDDKVKSLVLCCRFRAGQRPIAGERLFEISKTRKCDDLHQGPGW